MTMREFIIRYADDIDPKFKYVAMDETKRWHAYKKKPVYTYNELHDEWGWEDNDEEFGPPVLISIPLIFKVRDRVKPENSLIDVDFYKSKKARMKQIPKAERVHALEIT